MGYKTDPADNLESTIVLLSANDSIPMKDKIKILNKMSEQMQPIFDYQKTICDYYVMNKFLHETSSYDREGFADAQHAVERSDRLRKSAHDKMMRSVKELNNIALHEAKGMPICDDEYMQNRWTMTDFATNFINGMLQKEYDLEHPDTDKLVKDIENKKVYLEDAKTRFQELAEKYGISMADSENSEETGAEL